MTVSVTHAQIPVTTATPSHNSVIMALATSTATIERPSSPGGNSSGSDNDAITNSPSSKTALRRLYFKSGRIAKTKTTTTTTVPKVVVMGSSTASASETTINTSTESASTLVTSVTATDTSEACDSLDMGDNLGQNEPLLSSLDEPQHSGGSNESEQDLTEFELTSSTILCGGDGSLYIKNTCENIESSLSTSVTTVSHQHHHQQSPILSSGSKSSTTSAATNNKIPRTAPVVSSSVHFPFDPPASPKSVRTTEKDQNLFTFKEATIYLEQQKHEKVDKHELKQFPYAHQQQQHNHHHNQYQKRDIIMSGSNSSKEMQRSSWNEGCGKENRKHKNSQSGNKFINSSGRNSGRGGGVTTPTAATPIMNDGGSRHHLQDKLDMNEVSRDQRKEIKMKLKNNRYMNSSPKKDRLNSNQNKINSLSPVSSKEKFYGPHKHTNNTSSTSSTNISGVGGGGGVVGVGGGGSSGSGSSGYDYDQKDLTMFPFDREAIDYDRIQRECFTVEDDPKFPYDENSDSDSDSDEDASVYERKTFGSPLKSSKNDIFQQYTLLSQQETYYSHERRHSKRNRPDLIHIKYDHIAKSDAFTPKPSLNNDTTSFSSPKPLSELHKFEQIASKFEQIPPKCHNDINSSYHQFHGSNNSLSKNPINSSQTMLNNIGNSNLNATASGGSNGSGGLENSAASTGIMLLQQHQQHQHQHQHQHHQQHDILDECQKLHPSTGSINVTANPMETAVCTQPRATIVVQQPSLSLDNTVETLLLKNEGDFVSVEQAKESRKKKQQREENMRQLLDVTNTLTFEELRDFEMRYGSPHHSRSQSVKTPGSRASGRPNQLSLPQQRSRVASMPNTGVEEEYYRLRHFSITGKGVVNRGDSLKSRRSRSNNSVASSNSSTEHLTANTAVAGSAKTSATCSLASSRESSTSNPGNGPYRVLMLGSAAVGKSSLVSQFMTSEYLHAYDTSIDDESGEKSVSVLLSGEESELIFIDHAYSEMSPENCLSSYDPHGYCVIYSSADRSSFIVAERVLQALWTTENIAQKAVILVGNKADLARSRVVTSDEGKAMATAYDCKFIETSVGINHNVDELLVGLLSQIRLKLENPEKSRDLFRKRSSRKSKRRACSPLGGAATACLTGSGGTNPGTPLGPPANLISEYSTPPGSAHSSPRKYRGSRTSASLKVKGLLGRVWARDSKSKSCENLHVL